MPATRTYNAFPETNKEGITIHTTCYDHVILVTVGPLSPEWREDLIFEKVLNHFKSKKIAKKLTKPARWSVSRSCPDASAPTLEMLLAIREQRDNLLTRHYDVKTFYAHDESGECPQCKIGSSLWSQPTIKCINSKNAMMQRTSDGTPY